MFARPTVPWQKNKTGNLSFIIQILSYLHHYNFVIIQSTFHFLSYWTLVVYIESPPLSLSHVIPSHVNVPTSRHPISRNTISRHPFSRNCTSRHPIPRHPISRHSSDVTPNQISLTRATAPHVSSSHVSLSRVTPSHVNRLTSALPNSAHLASPQHTSTISRHPYLTQPISCHCTSRHLISR